MKRVIQEHLIDCSDPDKFVYNLICPECGKLWQSTPVPFSKAGQAPQTESKKVIFYRAVEEAVHCFNLCPVCERLVCNDCFLICQDIDMCRRCAEQLQETGEQVSFSGWTTQADPCDGK